MQISDHPFPRFLPISGALKKGYPAAHEIVCVLGILGREEPFTSASKKICLYFYVAHVRTELLCMQALGCHRATTSPFSATVDRLFQ